MISVTSGFTFYDDAWAFDGRGCTALGPSGAQRSGQAPAYDSRRHRVMSFGGYCTCRAEDNGRHNDLLRLESGRWQPVTSLSQRPTTDAGMVYDEVRDRLVMYGGSGGSQQALSDTWEFDGTTWRQTATVGPGALVGFSMVYDAKGGRTLLFGGFTTNPGAPSGDLWAYNDASWQRLSTNGPARHSAGAAFDTRRGLLIVFGGVDASGFIGDTWSWDGSTWQRLAAAGPEARAMGYLAYDKSRDRMVMFGGRKSGADLNDTWEWDGSGWARFVAPSR